MAFLHLNFDYVQSWKQQNFEYFIYTLSEEAKMIKGWRNNIVATFPGEENHFQSGKLKLVHRVTQIHKMTH